MNMLHDAFRRTVLIGLAAVVLLGGALAGPAAAAKWLGPLDIVASPDGQKLFVACYDAKQVLVVETAGRKVAASIAVPAPPTGLALNQDGSLLYVTCAAPKSVVAVIDTAKGAVAKTIPVGHTAVGPALSPDGATLYVCNRFNNDVSVIDLAAGRETGRIACIREPISAAISPDGATLLVANHLPLDPSDSYDVAAVVTVVDTASGEAKHLRLLNGSSSVRRVAMSPEGDYAYVTHILSRYQMPTTQLERGWMNTNALTIIDVAARAILNTVLLDDVDLGAAMPWGATTTADGKTIVVAHGSTHEISVIDRDGLIEKIKKMPPPPEDDRYAYSHGTSAGVPNDLSFLVDLRRRLRLPGNGPRGVAVAGTRVFAAEYFSDTLATVELPLGAYPRVEQVPLGPKPEMTVQRWGEQLFHDAMLCFQQWQSCASCHPDVRADGLNWDLLNDGLGNPKNTKSMLLSHQTPPAMSTGVRMSAEQAVRSGIRHIQFAVRPEEEAVAIDEFLKALEPVPSPYLVDGKLSEKARRGEKLFFDPKVGCADCHPKPLYTDLNSHNVGSRGKFGKHEEFDTPTLIEVWRTAPYMHDGQYTTLKELLTRGKHGSAHRLSEQEIDDLVEFVLSL